MPVTLRIHMIVVGILDEVKVINSNKEVLTKRIIWHKDYIKMSCSH